MWFLDFQYYQIGDEIFPKEINLLHHDTVKQGITFFAKSPTDYNFPTSAHSTLAYQYGRHKTPWNHGSVTDWKSILMSIIEPGETVCVKGSLKATFLQKNGFNALNVDTIGVTKSNPNGDCKSMQKLYEERKAKGHEPVKKCQFHVIHRGVCAVANTYVMREWYLNYNYDCA